MIKIHKTKISMIKILWNFIEYSGIFCLLKRKFQNNKLFDRDVSKLSMYYNTPHFGGLPCMFQVSDSGLKVYNPVQTILHYSSKSSEFEHISSCFDLRKFPPLCYHGNYTLWRFGYKNVQISMVIVYTTTQYLLGLEQVFFFTLKRHPPNV